VEPNATRQDDVVCGLFYPGGFIEEVVGAVLFLASSQANYNLGEVIEVNGGILMD